MSALSTLASARSAGRTRSSESNATHSYGTYAREVLQVRPPAVLVLQEVSDVDFQRDRAVPGSRIDLGREVIHMVNCPKCGYPQYCGCPACLPRLPEGYKPEIRNPDGGTLSCANCGYTQSYDGWLMIAEEQLKEQGKAVVER